MLCAAETIRTIQKTRFMSNNLSDANVTSWRTYDWRNLDNWQHKQLQTESFSCSSVTHLCVVQTPHVLDQAGEHELAELPHVCFPTFVSSIRTPFVRTFSITNPRIANGTCFWRFLSFRVCPWFRVLPGLLNQLSMFHPCEPLGPLDFAFFFCFLDSFLCLWLKAHSWTMTCFDCVCQTINCQLFCLPCSLVENVLHHTKHPSRRDFHPFPVPDERELTASHQCDLNVHPNLCHSIWNHEFSNQTSSPRASRLPNAHLRKFTSD